MSKMNVEPLATFPDGSQLLVSTHYSGEGSFTCELYVSRAGEKGKLDLRVVSDHLEAQTCRQAQDMAYTCARRLYPNTTSDLKAPPYLIWSGPNLPVAPDNRGRRLERR